MEQLNRPYEDIARSLGVRASRGAGAYVAADDLLLPLDHLHPQRVAPVSYTHLRAASRGAARPAAA